MFNTSYDLSVPSGAPVTRVFLSQCDNGLNSFTLRLYANNRPQTVEEGITAVIVGMKPSGKIFTYPVEITQDRTAVKVTTTAQMTAEKGLTTAQIIFTDPEGKTAGTCNFQLSVEADPTANGVISESDLIVFYQAIEAAERAETAASTAQEAAAGIEADQPVVVTLSVTAAAVATAVTQSQESGEPVTLAAQYVTADPADASTIRAAIAAGKKVRFDLTAEIGGGFVVHASAERCRTATGGRDITHYITAFDRGDLCGYFAGLELLKIDYTYDAGGRNSVTVTVNAAGGYYDAENQLYVL